MEIRKAEMKDCEAIYTLIDDNLKQGTLMHIPKGKIRRNIQNSIVAFDGQALIGNCTKYVHARGIYEIGSLIVAREQRDKGIGKELNSKILEGIVDSRLVFIATTIPEYAERLGYVAMSRRELPAGVWLHKIGSLLEQRVSTWPDILRKKYVFMKHNPWKGNNNDETELVGEIGFDGRAKTDRRNLTEEWMRQKALKVLAIVLGVVAVLILGFTITAQVLGRNLENLRTAHFKTINLSAIKDGSYRGAFHVLPIRVKLDVIMENGAIKRIDVLEHRNGKGKAAEAILQSVVDAQKIDVNVIAGATYSSVVIKKAIENALDGRE